MFPYHCIVLAIFLSGRVQPGRLILPWPAPRTVVPSVVPESKERVLATEAAGTQQTKGNAASKTKIKPAAKPSQDEVETTRSTDTSTSCNSAHPSSPAPLGSLSNGSYVDCDINVDIDESHMIEYKLPVESRGALIDGESIGVKSMLLL